MRVIKDAAPMCLRKLELEQSLLLGANLVHVSLFLNCMDISAHDQRSK